MRHDKHARLCSARLFVQALGLFGAAVVSFKLFVALDIRTAHEALLAGVLVFMTWLVFSICMRSDLMGHSPNGNKV